MGCTMMTDWKKESRKVVSHSLDFSLPHCMLYRMVKNPEATVLKKHTGERKSQSGRRWKLKVYKTISF